ncbi:MAG TPA: hypothetical protein DCZ95_12050 [Verrucomicrobia bacterium]|nr:MAG: hypothetical protein A2X46_14100 [Lentisphaerae bacterium GWF2_57_35]HBA84817.1 hypothetical protein [Verrucomicrobiota bacterium]
MSTSPPDETLLAYDQQFEIQVAMVINGLIPQGGSSLDFIVKMLKRHQYKPERIAVMEAMTPLVKEEISYLEAKATYTQLEATRQARLDRIEKLMG